MRALRATTSAVGLAFERIRGINDRLNEQVAGRDMYTWWSLSSNDKAGSVPTYMSIWSRRHKYKNGRDIPRTSELHKHVRFVFHGPIEVAERLLKEGKLAKSARLVWEL